MALSPEVAARAARLMGWEAVRLAQDDVLWKPPGATFEPRLGRFHQVFSRFSAGFGSDSDPFGLFLAL